ncbi:Tm-1-like ATP-binding domain-containing protein [Staphylococcus warneri]|uniref:Tm-1-like ATP-binding domain-containing protein n=1 Tax=Staphylococcus warneri TaxID=1292 RepID=UPI0021AD5194|nr:Tm-1-like ATP-binding domain-containing protein [Staphylococcus warneri]UUY70099.1 Tm-1-like ATP-binding domain-containing protein [Staphylococcus warneri]
MKTVAIIGTFDTKAKEFSYVKDEIERLGFNTLMIHTGVYDSLISVDITNQQVLDEVDVDITELIRKSDRAYATDMLAKGMQSLLLKLFEAQKFDGVISLGGSSGTAIATAGMKELPIGIPKVMVSTMTSGDISQYVGTSDIFMMPSIVDIAGLNKISKQIFMNAINALGWMLSDYELDFNEDKPLIAASMFGVTTPVVTQATEILEQHGYEVVIFHATGTGGKAMEDLIRSGYFEGVLDLTTTEWADQLCGGVLSAGESRLDAAIENNIPQVVSLGALDMVNFGPKETVPEQYKNRLLYQHNPSVTLMRTTVEENIKIGHKIVEKLNKADTNTALVIPVKGISAIDKDGEIFYDEKATQALINTIKENLNSNITIHELDYHINDKTFSNEVSRILINAIEK